MLNDDAQNWRIAFFLFLCFAMVTPMIQMFYLHGFRRAHDFVCRFAFAYSFGGHHT